QPLEWSHVSFLPLQGRTPVLPDAGGGLRCRLVYGEDREVWARTAPRDGATWSRWPINSPA
ncbi:MAG TPA: hypothetical protein VIO38_01205, partial [Rariglobus sp.]